MVRQSDWTSINPKGGGGHRISKRSVVSIAQQASVQEVARRMPRFLRFTSYSFPRRTCGVSRNFMPEHLHSELVTNPDHKPLTGEISVRGIRSRLFYAACFAVRIKLLIKRENVIHDMASIFVSLIIGFLFGSFLPKYFSKKGENLATKEDISEITEKIEFVKNEYANSLESVKAELSAKLNTHGFRYENEYTILSELTGLLVDVRDASVSLRPVMDFKDPGKKDEDIKLERLQRLFDARKSLYYAREKKRPFYPDDIYQSILAIEKTVHSESIKYQYQDPFEKGGFMSYWKEAEDNQNEITSSAELAMEKIRSRVNKWESLGAEL